MSLRVPPYGPEAAAAAGSGHGSDQGAPRAAAEPSRWSPDRANRWYQAQGWLVGANFVTSTAINQLEMFQPAPYDPRRIDTELGWARSHGFNTVRVFLHDQLWAQDARGFQTRLAQFVGIAARRRHQAVVRVVRLVLGPAAQTGSAARTDAWGAQLRLGAEPRRRTPRRPRLHPALCTTTSRA